MKIKLLSEILKLFPNFQPGWRGAPPDRIVANPCFGTLLHAVVCNDAGVPLYDQPVWAEPAGAITVPLTAEGKLGFVENYRPAVSLDGVPYPPTTLNGCGVVSLELPRGFPNAGETADQAALREAVEEMGFEATMAERIGETNPNTTYFPNSQQIFLVTLTSRKSEIHRPDPTEQIRARFLTTAQVLEAIATGKIFCGMTKSALMTYFSSDRGQAALRSLIPDGQC